MKLYIKILVIVLFFAYCNMFFYKKNQPIPYLSFIEGDYFAEVLLQWKERLEHPLSGTTKKKDYKTDISIIQLTRNGNEINKSVKKTYSFSNWILPEFLYVININPLQILFFYGNKPEDYGIKNLFGYYYETNNSNKIEISQIVSLDNIKFFLPSPNKKSLFTITTNHRIQIYQINADKLTLLQETNLPLGITDVRLSTWDPQNFNLIYIYDNNKVYLYNLINNSVEIAKQFPECIIPGTSFGGSFDNDGNQFFYDVDNQKYAFVKLKNFYNFYQKRYINDPSKVQYSCFD